MLQKENDRLKSTKDLDFMGKYLDLWDLNICGVAGLSTKKIGEYIRMENRLPASSKKCH